MCQSRPEPRVLLRVGRRHRNRLQGYYSMVGPGVGRSPNIQCEIHECVCHDGETTLKEAPGPRVLLHAPGRSEDVVHRAQFGEETLWWRGDYALFDTRADAAAAAWKQDRTGPAFEGETFLTREHIDRELERVWETQPAPEYDLSKGFWRDAYRVVR